MPLNREHAASCAEITYLLLPENIEETEHRSGRMGYQPAWVKAHIEGAET